MDITRYTKVLFWTFIKYFILSYEVIFHPKKTMNFLWERRGNEIVSPYLFFFINVCLIQLISFITNKVATSGLSGISGAIFTIPIIGSINATYFINMISYYTGACIVSFFFLYMIFNGKALFEKIIYVVVYSSVLLLLWETFGSMFIYGVTYFFIEVLGFNSSIQEYVNSVSSLRVVSDIEFIRVFFAKFFKIGIAVEVVGIISYFAYLYNMISCLIPDLRLQIKRTLYCIVIYFFLVITPFYVKGEMIDSEFIEIEQSVERIKLYQNFITKINNEEFVELSSNAIFDIKYEYLTLSQHTSLAERDKYEMFKKYVLLNNIGIIAERWNKSNEIIMVDVYYDAPICSEYLFYIVNNNIDAMNVKKIMLLDQNAKIEKNILGQKSSINIMIDKHIQKQRQFMAQFLIPLSFVRLFP